LVVRNTPSAAITQKLGQLSPVKRAAVTKDADGKVTVTVFPKPNANGELTRAVMDASHGWHVEELHTEEGRLDEVFRSITMPDTAKGDAK
jgi:ABC-2 type transport system ATP-binding protein